MVLVSANGHFSGNATAGPSTQVVLGSMERAQEYQSLLVSLNSAGGSVQGEMVDRILDNATSLPAPPLTIHTVLPLPLPSTLLSRIPPSTQLFVHLPTNPPAAESTVRDLHAALAQAAFAPLLPTPASDIVAYTSPQAPAVPLVPSQPAPMAKQGESSSAGVTAIRPLNLKRSSNRAQKAAIWALDSPLLPDGGRSLLTPEDKARPECVFPAADGKPVKRRRACKDCTCGLKELEDEEERQTAAAVREAQKAFFLEGDDDIPDVLKTATQGTEGIWPQEKRAAAKKTGSCGNCSLGDAFRCASCPYIGLPAFKPGDKIELLIKDDI